MGGNQSGQQLVRFWLDSTAATGDGMHYETAGGTEWYDAPNMGEIRPETGIRTGRRIGEVIYPD